ESVDAWLGEHAADEGLLSDFPETGRLKTLSIELAELSEKQKSFAKWTRNTTASRKNNKATMERESKKMVEGREKIKEEEQELVSLAKGHDAEEIEALRSEQQERVRAFQELSNLARTHRKLSDEGYSFFSNLFGK